MAIVSIGAMDYGDSNIYLVKGDINILIDTGLGRNPGALISRVRSALGGSDIDMIVLTHCHIDHIGGLRCLLDEFGCKAYAYGEDAGHIRDGNPVYVLSGMFSADYQGLPVEDLEDGQIIDAGAHKLEVIRTPGHTAGSICLYDHATKSLISGDTLFVGGYGRTDFVGGSLPKLVDSLRSLARFDFISLYPGHGGICSDRGNACLIEVLEGLGVCVEDY
jgi:glyoxylase-like metal-dependent hydrolase (beta-lactamase superfamily II)